MLRCLVQSINSLPTCFVISLLKCPVLRHSAWFIHRIWDTKSSPFTCSKCNVLALWLSGNSLKIVFSREDTYHPSYLYFSLSLNNVFLAKRDIYLEYLSQVKIQIDKIQHKSRIKTMSSLILFGKDCYISFSFF